MGSGIKVARSGFKGVVFLDSSNPKCHQRFVDECLVIICEVFLGDFLSSR